MFSSATLSAPRRGSAGAWWGLRILTATANRITCLTIPARVRRRYGILTTMFSSATLSAPRCGSAGAWWRLEWPLGDTRSPQRLNKPCERSRAKHSSRLNGDLHLVKSERLKSKSVTPTERRTFPPDSDRRPRHIYLAYQQFCRVNKIA